MITLKDLKEASKIYDEYGDSDRQLVPTNRNRYVGVELECVLPTKDYDLFGDEEYITKLALMAMLQKEGLAKKIQFTSDSSIDVNGYETDLELRILDTERNIFSTMEKVCAILKEFGAKVNNSCGLHVHLDMRNRSEEQLEKIFNNFLKSQDYLISLVARHRISSSYCDKMEETRRTPDSYERTPSGDILYLNNMPVMKRGKEVPTTWEIEKKYGGDHHMGLNMVAAYEDHETFEIRFHEATLDAQKINKWIATLLKISKAKTIKTKITKENVAVMLKLGESNVRP